MPALEPTPNPRGQARGKAEEASGASPLGSDVLASFIEHTPVAVAMFDREMRYLAASRRWLEDYRLEGRAILGLSHYDLFPELPDRWKEVHRRCLAGETLRAEEDGFQRLDGSLQWIRWEVRPWSNGEGAVGGLVIYAEDISNRKEAELALAEERETFRSLTRIASDYFWKMDEAFRITEYSPVSTERSGLDQGQFIGKTRWELPFVGVTEAAWRKHRDLLESHRPFRNFEGGLLNEHGELRWLAISGDPVFSAAQVFKGYRGITRDITGQRQDEQKLRQQAMVFSQAQEGIVITDPKACVLDANPAFERITEYSAEEVRGRNLRFLQSGRHDLAFYQEMWKSILGTGSWQGEIWNRRKGGEVYYEWINISAVRDARGGVVAYVGLFIDISRMQHARSELERLALHDALTNLPNRLLLVSRLKHAVDRTRRSTHSGAVLFMDLDRFKTVNDSLGHRAGDELLLEVACRVRGRLRDIDTLARLGGDEFVIVLEETSHPGAAEKVAQDVIECLHEPFVLPGGQVVEIGGSIGIARFPADGTDPDGLIDLADHALYEAKRAGRGVFRRFGDQEEP